MMFRPQFRRRTAILILSVFTLGGILAPLSHLFYMAVSDVFVPAQLTSGTDISVHRAAGHVVESESGYLTETDISVVPVDEEHFVCDYAALFATPVTAHLAASPDFSFNLDASEFVSHEHRSLILIRPPPFPVRGPPVEMMPV